MNCRQCTEFIIEYVEGDLAGETRVAFEGHISRCPTCVRYIETYRETIALGKQAFHGGEGVVFEPIPDELVRAILASRPLKD
jgi:anti-sigma factor RsiW